jgi:glucose-1-phosphate adenylyltransferase
MGGGRGTGLFPLTKDRAKAAVPFAGKYRLVDIPISNCLNSSFRRVYVLTQFNSTPLHRHISQTYKFDHFSDGFLEILAAQQTHAHASWYEGSADAARKNLLHFLSHDFEYLLFLSGDHLYRMDFRQLLEQHLATGAEITIATTPVGRERAGAFGIMKITDDGRITRFVEKPQGADEFESLKLPPPTQARLHLPGGEVFLASMGIYLFNRDLIHQLLDNSLTNFGHDIIPRAITTHRVFAHVFQGYWEDIGAIRSFFEANLDLTAELPRFNCFDMTAPVFSHPRFLPGSKINGAEIDHSIISDGCIINRARIRQSIVGLRTIVESGTTLERVVILGSDDYELPNGEGPVEPAGLPRIGIGANCKIENAIIDKNARIGNNVTISPAGKPENIDRECYFIRDGIVVIPRKCVVPDGTVI